MTNLVTAHFPDTGLSALPDLDVELSLAPPTQGPIWRSIVSDARLASGLSTKRGRSRETDRFQTGTLDIDLNNRDREFDPEHASSPIYEHIKPERRIRVLAKYNDVQYVVFDGFVDGFEQSYPEQDSDAVVSISAGDGFKVLAQCDLPDSWLAVQAGLLNAAHWWPLEDEAGTTTARDRGANASDTNALITSGNPTFGATAIVPSGSGSCVSFDGTDDILGMNPDGKFGPGTGAIFAWFTHPTVATTNRTLFTIHSLVNAAGIHVYIPFSGGNTGKLVADYYDSGVVVDTAVSTSRGDDSEPHSIAYANDSGLYVDGTNVSAASGTVATRAPVYVGAKATNTTADQVFPATFSAFWAGSVSNVLLTFGAAWSAADIAALHAAGVESFSGDTTGTAARRILDFIGWPGKGLSTAAERDIDTGSSTIGAVELSGGSALDYLQALHDTEQGQFYMGLDGAMSSDSTFKFCWRQRHALITGTRSATSQATFGDSGAELKYADILIDYGENRLYNEARVSRSGGNEQVSSDAESQREYLKRTYSKSGLLYESDNEAFDHATWAVNRYSDPEYRIIGLVLKPQRDGTNLWPQALGREIGDRITVKRRPQGVGDVISKEVIIEGVEHSMSDGEWTTVWRLSEVDTTQYWVLDDATLSVLDTTTVPAF